MEVVWRIGDLRAPCGSRLLGPARLAAYRVTNKSATYGRRSGEFVMHNALCVSDMSD